MGNSNAPSGRRGYKRVPKCGSNLRSSGVNDGHLWVSITVKLTSLILGQNFIPCSSIHMNCTTDQECCQETTWTRYDSIRQRNSKGLYYTYWLRTLPFIPYVIVLRTHGCCLYRRRSLLGGMIHTHWKFTLNQSTTIVILYTPLQKGTGDLNKNLETPPPVIKRHPRRKHKR
jgi:hypothetical protein